MAMDAEDSNVQVPHPQPVLSGERQQIYRMLCKVEHLQRLETADFETALTVINQTSVESVPGAQYAGVTFIDGDGAVQTVAATHPYSTWLDLVQREVGEGPCLSAAWQQHTIHIDDMTTDARWPLYCDAALARTPVRSVLSFKLFGDGKRMAALNFYSQAPGAFDTESIELGLIFATQTTLAWNALTREQQFRSAIANRDIIGQAKGILMERFKIDAIAAFELLRKFSQQSNTKLFDIADRLARPDRPESRET